MAAEITFNQPTGAGAGVAGKARNDIWLSQVVNMESSGTGASYLWELLNAPPGSAATIVNPTASTANITPDVMGTYRIRLTVDGGGVGNVVTKVIRARYDSTGVIYKRGWALPAVDEEITEADYGTNDRHWDEVWQAVTTDMRGSLTKTLVYQPSGTAEGNTFDDWSLLMVAFGETEGNVNIVVDDSSGSVVIPSGTWDLEKRGSIVGISVTGTTVQIATGGVVLNPAELWYVRCEADGVYRGVLRISTSQCHVYGSILTNTSALQSIMEVAPESTVWLHDSYVSNGVGGGASSVLTHPLGAPAGAAVLRLGGYSFVDDNTLNGPRSWDIYLDSTSTATTTHANCSGTVTVIAPSTGITTTFVFQPSGTAAGNVYTDWSLLMADHANTEGPKIIEIDSSIAGVATIPAGTWSLGRNTVLRGKFADVNMADGAVFEDAVHLDGFWTLGSSSSGPIFTWTSGARYLVLREGASINSGVAFGPAPTSPLITAAVTMYLYDHSSLAASSGEQPILEDSLGSTVRMFDGSAITPSDGGGGDSYALNVTGLGAIVVEIYSSGVRFKHATVSGLSWEPYSVRREVIPLTKGVVSNSAATPAVCGAAYLSFKNIPKFANAKCYFRAIIETTSGTVGSEAYVDLFDVFGQLNSGTPIPVVGSQIDTGTGSPPAGAPTPNALLPSLYEVELTSAIIGGSWVSDIAIFEARVWIGTASGGNAATCKSAELIFEWTEN